MEKIFSSILNSRRWFHKSEIIKRGLRLKLFIKGELSGEGEQEKQDRTKKTAEKDAVSVQTWL